MMNEELLCSVIAQPILHSKLYRKELNYTLWIRLGLHGFHGFIAMIT